MINQSNVALIHRWSVSTDVAHRFNNIIAACWLFSPYTSCLPNQKQNKQSVIMVIYVLKTEEIACNSNTRNTSRKLVLLILLSRQMCIRAKRIYANTTLPCMQFPHAYPFTNTVYIPLQILHVQISAYLYILQSLSSA